jgi:hypothetical protein
MITLPGTIPTRDKSAHLPSWQALIVGKTESMLAAMGMIP